MDTNLVSIGKNEPSFYYPAIPDEVAADQDQVIVAYRRALGRERMYQVGGGVLAVLALWLYVRGQRKPTGRTWIKNRKPRSSDKYYTSRPYTRTTRGRHLKP
jgi:hypothetical protein